MKKTLYFFSYNGFFISCLWFGFIEGIKGAQHIAMFAVWSIFLLSFSLLIKTNLTRMAAEPDFPMPRFLAVLIGLLAMAMFVWFGGFLSAAAQGLTLFIATVARNTAKRIRADAIKSQQGKDLKT